MPASNRVLTDATGQDIVAALQSIGGAITPVVDDLTTQDANKALSANQGYILNRVKLAESVANITGAKNMLPATLDIIKPLNTAGTWSDNIYTVNSVAFTVNTDSKGNVTSIKASGQASANVTFFVASRFASSPLNLPTGDYTLNGCPEAGSSTTYEMRFQATRNGSLHSYGYDRGAGVDGSVLDTDSIQVVIYVQNGFNMQDKMFYPMIRMKAFTDATYEPYAKTNLGLTNDKVETTALGTNESGKSTASRAYAAGEYFYKDGYFGKALTSISSGATFTLNTNYAQLTLAEILQAIEAQL